MKAFYFSNKERKLRFEDNRVIRTGRTHKVDGDIIPCENGLHASERLIDALYYAPGNILWHVELGGDIVRGDDKVAASERTYLSSFDATDLLRVFARKQALIHIEKIKPHCTSDEYDLIVRYLETGDDEIRESVHSVAYSAAESASSAAYWAEGSAARSAVRSVYWAVNSDAYLAAEASEHVSGNYNIKLDRANQMLTDMVREATGWEI